MLPKTMHLLLIEDNPGDATLLRELLDESDLPQIVLEHVDHLSSGLAVLSRGGIDLILLDLTLPDSYGVDTFRQIYRHAPDIPIVVLTGLRDHNTGMQLVASGAQDYLIKGQVDYDSLLRSIRYALGRHQVVTALRQTEALLQAERASLVRQVEERTAALQASNRNLERALRLKDEFLASMSHELRTPLNGILGISEALEEQVYGPLLERQIVAVHQVAQSGQHLLTLINSILDFAKITAQKVQLTSEPVDMAAICRASLDVITPAAQKKHLSITVPQVPQDLRIYSDSRRLTQVLTNLLSNAVKFTPAGGAIGLEVVGDSRAVHCTVWDTGIGIAEEDLPRLFQPFVQLDAGLARQYDGTGMGLAVAQRLMDMFGGTITVASTIGRGSRFTVTLPWLADGAADG
jgi:signal transduction histidine kinase